MPDSRDRAVNRTARFLPAWQAQSSRFSLDVAAQKSRGLRRRAHHSYLPTGSGRPRTVMLWFFQISRNQGQPHTQSLKEGTLAQNQKINHFVNWREGIDAGSVRTGTQAQHSNRAWHMTGAKYTRNECMAGWTGGNTGRPSALCRPHLSPSSLGARQPVSMVLICRCVHPTPRGAPREAYMLFSS